MARNRTTQDREEKRSEIVDAATQLFTQQGYEATSIGAVAKVAGIATNTIYWYFDDKDALLVEVLRRVTRAALSEYLADPPATLTDRLLWLVDAIERMSSLMVTVHARAPMSETVRTWHDGFHAAGDQRLLADIREHFAAKGAQVPSEARLATIPRIWMYAIEGMITHDLEASERRQLCDVLVRQLDAL